MRSAFFLVGCPGAAAMVLALGCGAQADVPTPDDADSALDGAHADTSARADEDAQDTSPSTDPTLTHETATHEAVPDEAVPDEAAHHEAPLHDVPAAPEKTQDDEAVCDPMVVQHPLINDFENGEVNVESPSGIPQTWYPGGVITEEREFGILPLADPREGTSSELGASLRGVGTGGMIGVTFWGCYALPAAKGIRFSVRVDTEGGQVEPLRMVVRGDTLANSPPHAGGSCADCMQNYTTVDLEAGWQEIEVSFDEFTGGTYPYDPEDQRGFSFQWHAPYMVPVAWELWVDDVSYVF